MGEHGKRRKSAEAADTGLVKRLKALFALATDHPDFKAYGSTGRISRHKSWAGVADLLGITEFAFSRWTTGNGRSAGEVVRTTERLISIVLGEFSHILDGSVRAQAAIIHAFWVSKYGQPILDRLQDELSAHLDALLEKREEDQRSRLEEQIRAHPMSLLSVADTTSLPDGRRWSDGWTEKQVARMAARFRRGHERIVYYYGARGSGKTQLIAGLKRILEADTPPPDFLFLDIKALDAQFQVKPDEQIAHQAILDRLCRQIAPPGGTPSRLVACYDFKTELTNVLSRSRAPRIYLIVTNCDAALRHSDPVHAKASRDMTSHFFTSLNSAGEGNPEPPFDRVFLIMEGSRPVRDLNDAYPGSPFNNATTETLLRFTKDEWVSLAAAADLADSRAVERLMLETGGHRSLLWSLIRSAEPDQPFPEQLAMLPLLEEPVGDLIVELQLQPDLRAALEAIATGQKVGLDERTRLAHLMYVNGDDPPGIACPLLEYMLEQRGILAPSLQAGNNPIGATDG